MSSFGSTQMETIIVKGYRVLAKTYKGELSALRYANRTQAEKKANEVGGTVLRYGRPSFLIALNFVGTIEA